MLNTIASDLRCAWRALGQRPGAAAIIVVTLALGLGTNAAIYSVVDALVLRPFALPDLDRLVFVMQTSGDGGYDARETVAPANFLDWRRDADTFASLAAEEWWDVNLAGADEPERVLGQFVSPGYFETLGVPPILGRSFRAEEERRGLHRRAILGYDLWQRRFQADPGILGRTILLDAEPYEVVGIAPAGFGIPHGTEIWAPLSFTAEQAARRSTRYLTVVGRLAPGRTLADAQAQMATIGARLEAAHPEANRGRAPRVLTFHEGTTDPGLPSILVLWQASALFVLLIAGANVANLLLARGAERRRDFAVRLALGSSRARIIRQLLFESLLLAALALPLALGVAGLPLHAIRVAMPSRILRFIAGWDTMDVDTRTLLVTAALAVVAAAACAIVPALQATRANVTATLRDGGRGVTAGRHRLRRALVVAEIALALPLLVAAALSIGGVYRFLNGPQGYEPDGLLVAQAVLPDARYGEPETRRGFVDRVVERVGALPGVTHAAAINVMPAGGGNTGRAVAIEGRPAVDPANPPTVDYRAATPGVFDTLRIPIRRGRGFTVADHADAAQVAIVSESMAATHWPGEDPLGRRLRLGEGPWVFVIGVSGDVVRDWYGRRSYPTVYRPYAQAPTGALTFVARTAGDPLALTRPVVDAVRAIDPAQPLFDVMPMRQRLSDRTIALQYVAGIMSVFGLLALALAVVGIYGVMHYLVAQRTHEIGVRIALGASAGQVFRLTVWDTARLAVTGIAAGLALSLGAGRLLESVLFGAIANDARLQAALAVILAASALLAGIIPARRAAAIDPVVALRND